MPPLAEKIPDLSPELSGVIITEIDSAEAQDLDKQVKKGNFLGVELVVTETSQPIPETKLYIPIEVKPQDAIKALKKALHLKDSVHPRYDQSSIRKIAGYQEY
jgi:hypothetical protein